MWYSGSAMEKTQRTPTDEKNISYLARRRSNRLSFGMAVVVTVLVGWGGYVLGTRVNVLPSSNLSYGQLDEVYRVLVSKYDGKLDKQKLLDGAKRGLVDAAGDPYTVYFTADQAKEFSSDLNGKFEGIGAELGKTEGRLTILSVIGDSPAQNAGLQAKDIIYKVNDEETAKMTVSDAVKKIRGEKGTSVKLSIVRGGTGKDYTIVRDSITNPSVKSEVLNDGVGYMRITRFGDDTSSLARKAAQDFKGQNVSKVVLDLRGNGGGLLSAARDVSSLWLKDKVVVSERTNGVTTDTLRSESSPILSGVKTVVLVDGGSASASEIVAGALKDNGAATLVGEKTFGKGSVQTVENLAGGAELKVTIARWYTPLGKNINKEGIMPDKVVALSEDDVKAGRDPQKDAALAALR